MCLDCRLEVLCKNWLHTVRSNQNGWKAILWSKIRLLWHGIDHLKSAAIPFVRSYAVKNLLSKSVFECIHTKFFSKPQTLTSGSLSAPWDTRMHSTSWERSTNFLQHKILKKWIAALLRQFTPCQSNSILLYKVIFQPFWLTLTASAIFINNCC